MVAFRSGVTGPRPRNHNSVSSVTGNNNVECGVTVAAVADAPFNRSFVWRFKFPMGVEDDEREEGLLLLLL